MSDIVERLTFCTGLHAQVGQPENAKLFSEAAAEIQRLRAENDRLRDLVEFVRDLHPKVAYPPSELDDEPQVVIPESTWDAITYDARAALAKQEASDDD